MIAENEGTNLLNLCGARIIANANGFWIGIWADLDGPEIRRAIENVHLGEYPVIYLDNPDVPVHYKMRTCPVRLMGESFEKWKQRALALRKQQAAA